MITSDCGDTFKPLFDRKKLKDVNFHPTDENLILGISGEDELVLSKDGGATWKAIQGKVREYIFAKYSDNAYFSNKNRLFAIIEGVDNKKRITKNLFYSDDFFEHSQMILENVEFFKITKCCIYAKQKNGEMQVSDAFGWFYHFYPLKIENLSDDTFNEFNIIDNDVLYGTYGILSLNYKQTEVHKLMKTDSYGTEFEILQEDMVCEKINSYCDFFPIKSLDGVILINVYDKSYVEASLNLPKSRRKNYSQVQSFSDLRDFRYSLISFDYGEKFSRIKAPVRNHKNIPIDCDGECFLNIHIYSSFKSYQLPKSNENVPGFIIASGNVSKYLAESDD